MSQALVEFMGLFPPKFTITPEGLPDSARIGRTPDVRVPFHRQPNVTLATETATLLCRAGGPIRTGSPPAHLCSATIDGDEPLLQRRHVAAVFVADVHEIRRGHSLDVELGR